MKTFNPTRRWRLFGAAAVMAVAMLASLLAAPAPAQASAGGCDPWPKPPVLMLCFWVTGNGTYVDKVEFHSPLSEVECDTRGLIEFFDMRGRRVFAYDRDFGCSWGSGFWETPERHFPEGSVCARQMIDNRQAAGVCHRIRR